jgi:hypothetical protein
VAQPTTWVSVTVAGKGDPAGVSAVTLDAIVTDVPLAAAGRLEPVVTMTVLLVLAGIDAVQVNTYGPALPTVGRV